MIMKYVKGRKLNASGKLQTIRPSTHPRWPTREMAIAQVGIDKRLLHARPGLFEGAKICLNKSLHLLLNLRALEVTTELLLTNLFTTDLLELFSFLDHRACKG
jgi:hypothetical protein